MSSLLLAWVRTRHQVLHQSTEAQSLFMLPEVYVDTCLCILSVAHPAVAAEERSATPDSIASSSSAAPQSAVPPQPQAPYPGVQQGPPSGIDGKTSVNTHVPLGGRYMCGDKCTMTYCLRIAEQKNTPWSSSSEGFGWGVSYKVTIMCCETWSHTDLHLMLCFCVHSKKPLYVKMLQSDVTRKAVDAG